MESFGQFHPLIIGRKAHTIDARFDRKHGVGNSLDDRLLEVDRQAVAADREYVFATDFRRDHSTKHRPGSSVGQCIESERFFAQFDMGKMGIVAALRPIEQLLR
ncbi:hypothetical protein D3C87_1934390 [compost metagenome]